jgi:hypothetical protein
MMGIGTGIPQLGSAGVPHRDKDALNGFSAMTSGSDFDARVHVGNFYIFDLGISFLMQTYATIYFSGRHWHGGSQPVWLVEPPPFGSASRNTRVTHILYPKDRVWNDVKALTAIATLDNGEVMKLSRRTRMLE